MSILKQFFDEESCTYTYIISCQIENKAVIIDPVIEDVEKYLSYAEEIESSLIYALETHVHADHITGGGVLRIKTGAKTAVSELCGTLCADLQLNDSDIIKFGSEQIKVISTPGHTAGSVCFLWKDRLFTGDTLLIGGCGRTDFQMGDAGKLYDSITENLFKLPDETLVYPGHDYNHNYISCIAQERFNNPRLAGKNKKQFIEIMENLNLPDPKKMDTAVPANQQCGNIPDAV